MRPAVAVAEGFALGLARWDRASGENRPVFPGEHRADRPRAAAPVWGDELPTDSDARAAAHVNLEQAITFLHTLGADASHPLQVEQVRLSAPPGEEAGESPGRRHWRCGAGRGRLPGAMRSCGTGSSPVSPRRRAAFGRAGFDLCSPRQSRKPRQSVAPARREAKRGWKPDPTSSRLLAIGTAMLRPGAWAGGVGSGEGRCSSVGGRCSRATPRSAMSAGSSRRFPPTARWSRRDSPSGRAFPNGRPSGRRLPPGRPPSRSSGRRAGVEFASVLADRGVPARVGYTPLGPAEARLRPGAADAARPAPRGAPALPEGAQLASDARAAPQPHAPTRRGLYWAGMVLAYGLAVGVFGASVFLVVTSPSLWETGPQAPVPAPAPATAPAAAPARPNGPPAAWRRARPSTASAPASRRRIAAPRPCRGFRRSASRRWNSPRMTCASSVATPCRRRRILVPTRAEIALPLTALPSFASRLATFPYLIGKAPAEPSPPEPTSLQAPVAPAAAPTVVALALPSTDADGGAWNEEPPRPLPQAALPAEPSCRGRRCGSRRPCPTRPAMRPWRCPAVFRAIRRASAIRSRSPSRSRSRRPRPRPRSPSRPRASRNGAARQIARPSAVAEIPAATALAPPDGASAGGVSERAVEGMLRTRLLGR